jgi:2,3-bisphosphoglycerate-independent phosphoglycerate mutase
MKYVVCVPDGCADEPVAELDGRTPLEVASMPTLAALAAKAEVGRAAVIPPGMPPGSDVGNMSIFGYDPAVYHTGRSPIEAAAMGLRLEPDQVAFRCNLVTVGDDGTMLDFAGGHPSSAASAPVIEALERELGGDGVSFHPGVQYRHCVIAPDDLGDAACVPPHDLSDQAAVWPSGPAAERLTDLMERSRKVLGQFDIEATQIWLWGQGPQPELPSFSENRGLDAGLVTAVDLVRGLGVLSDVEVIEVEGATGWYDTDYEAKREATLDTLADGADLFILHVEATDEAGHAGDLDEKIRALENWDRRILVDLTSGLDLLGPWRMLLLPDHATPVARKTHTSDPVPYLLYDSGQELEGGVYTEAGTAASAAVPGHELMDRLTFTSIA